MNYVIKQVLDKLLIELQLNVEADRNILKLNLLSCGNTNTQNNVGSQVLQRQR